MVPTASWGGQSVRKRRCVYMCIRVCVCVHMKEKERECERVRARARREARGREQKGSTHHHLESRRGLEQAQFRSQQSAPIAVSSLFCGVMQWKLGGSLSRCYHGRAWRLNRQEAVARRGKSVSRNRLVAGWARGAGAGRGWVVVAVWCPASARNEAIRVEAVQFRRGATEWTFRRTVGVSPSASGLNSG